VMHRGYQTDWRTAFQRNRNPASYEANARSASVDRNTRNDLISKRKCRFIIVLIASLYDVLAGLIAARRTTIWATELSGDLECLR
jgi:hypothetical protein